MILSLDYLMVTRYFVFGLPSRFIKKILNIINRYDIKLPIFFEFRREIILWLFFWESLYGFLIFFKNLIVSNKRFQRNFNYGFYLNFRFYSVFLYNLKVDSSLYQRSFKYRDNINYKTYFGQTRFEYSTLNFLKHLSSYNSIMNDFFRRFFYISFFSC